MVLFVQRFVLLQPKKYFFALSETEAVEEGDGR
jgi:hypothetical protein